MDKRILCVDDEAVLRALLIRRCTEWGYDIECASGADEAIEMFEGMQPFLVITDLKLAEPVDGVTLADRLHRRDPMCIFIALSGFVNSFDLGYLLGAGVFTDVLLKPLEPDVLKTVIEYAWDKRMRWEVLNGN